MTVLQILRLQFDQKFRPRRFALVILNGMQSHLLGAPAFIKEYLDRQQAEAAEEEHYWKQRRDNVRALLAKLHEFGFRKPEDYLYRVHEGINPDAEMEILNLIRDIRSSEINASHQHEIDASVEKYNSEVEACKKVLSDVERMSPVVANLQVRSVEEIESAFRKNECAYLLSMPTIIDIEKIVREHYCQ